MDAVFLFLARIDDRPELFDTLADLGKAHGDLPIFLSLGLELFIEDFQFFTVLLERFVGFGQSLLRFPMPPLIIGDLRLARRDLVGDVFLELETVG